MTIPKIYIHCRLFEKHGKIFSINIIALSRSERDMYEVEARQRTAQI